MKFERTQSEKYEIKSDEDRWVASIFLEYPYPRHGAITIRSDYGEYTSYWNAIGDRHFKDFLIGLDDDYVLKNLTRGDGRWLDADTSVEKIKREILRLRRNKKVYETVYTYNHYLRKMESTEMDRELARSCWEEAENLSGCNSVDEWFRSVMDSECLFYALYAGEPPAIDCVTDYHPQARAFMKKVWHPFMNYLQATEFDRVLIEPTAPKFSHYVITRPWQKFPIGTILTGREAQFDPSISLEADGRELDRNVYPDLYEVLAKDENGKAFLPDLRVPPRYKLVMKKEFQ